MAPSAKDAQLFDQWERELNESEENEQGISHGWISQVSVFPSRLPIVWGVSSSHHWLISDSPNRADIALVQRKPRRFNRPDDLIGQLFNQLAAQWKNETAFESNPERIAMHWAYQRIIGLGAQALPFILNDLKESGAFWFWALAAIVGEDRAEGIQTVSDAVTAWLAWGREAGLVND